MALTREELLAMKNGSPVQPISQISNMAGSNGNSVANQGGAQSLSALNVRNNATALGKPTNQYTVPDALKQIPNAQNFINSFPNGFNNTYVSQIKKEDPLIPFAGSKFEPNAPKNNSITNQTNEYMQNSAAPIPVATRVYNNNIAPVVEPLFNSFTNDVAKQLSTQYTDKDRVGVIAQGTQNGIDAKDILANLQNGGQPQPQVNNDALSRLTYGQPQQQGAGYTGLSSAKSLFGGIKPTFDRGNINQNMTNAANMPGTQVDLTGFNTLLQNNQATNQQALNGVVDRKSNVNQTLAEVDALIKSKRDGLGKEADMFDMFKSIGDVKHLDKQRGKLADLQGQLLNNDNNMSQSQQEKLMLTGLSAEQQRAMKDPEFEQGLAMANMSAQNQADLNMQQFDKRMQELGVTSSVELEKQAMSPQNKMEALKTNAFREYLTSYNNMLNEKDPATKQALQVQAYNIQQRNNSLFGGQTPKEDNKLYDFEAGGEKQYFATTPSQLPAMLQQKQNQIQANEMKASFIKNQGNPKVQDEIKKAYFERFKTQLV